MSVIVRSRLPVYGVALIGFLLAFTFYVPIDEVKVVTSILRDYSVVITNVIIVCAVFHMTYYHSRIAYKQTPGRWWASIILIGVLWLYFGSGLVLGLGHDFLRWMLANVRTAAWTSVFALLCFWITGACYRTFRAKSWETAALLIVGFCVILRNAPLGNMIAPGIDQLADWFMSVPSPGAGTGVIIGTACGTAAIAIRILTGIERGYLGVVAEEA
jgi:hypothetical protein